MFENLAFQLFISVLIGGVIGLERESVGAADSRGSAGGIRTFALVSLLGGLAGFFYREHIQSVFLFLSSFIGILVLAYYIVGTLITKRTGLTNEISVIYTFLLGFLVTTGIVSMQIVLALLVVVLLILSLKTRTKRLMLGISSKEVEAFISYAIIAVVILPFLPNTSFQVGTIPSLHSFLASYNIDIGQWAHLEIFNPRKIGLIVALVTGIDVFGYVLGRIFGEKKSFTLASFVGGFISSTSTTQALAQKSKKSNLLRSLVGAALIANMASFFQIFLLVGPINSKWLVYITPTLFIIIAAALVLALLHLFDGKKDSVEKKVVKEKETKSDAIFSLVPALKFAGLLIIVKLITKVCLILFGQSGFIISSIIASFAGLDAILINLADMAGNVISFKMALITFLLVNATNLLSKSFYSWLQGDRRFALRFFLSAVFIITTSFVGLLFVR